MGAIKDHGIYTTRQKPLLLHLQFKSLGNVFVAPAPQEIWRLSFAQPRNCYLALCSLSGESPVAGDSVNACDHLVRLVPLAGVV